MSKEFLASVDTAKGLPEGLLYRVWGAESNYGDPRYMKSKAGAEGHFGFMPSAQKDYKLDDPYSLPKSASAAGDYYSRLIKKYGDVRTAAAAYNWGPGNVDSWQKTGLGVKGQPMPKETIGYMDKVGGPEKQDILAQIKAAKAGGVSDDDIWKNLPFTPHADGLKKAKADGLSDEQIAAGLGLKLTQVAPKPAQPKEERSGLSDFATGLKKSVLDTVQGLSQVSGEIGSAVANAHPLLKKFDRLGEFAGIPSSEQALQTSNAEINQRRIAEKPAMDTFAGNAGNVLGSIAQMVGPGMAAKGGSVVRNMLLTPKNVGQAAAGGAAFMGAQAVGEGESRGKNALIGAGGASLGYGVAKGLGALANGSSKVTPEIRELANAAKSKWGIDITAPQIVNNRLLNTAQSVVKDVPFSGAGKFVEKQQVQLNRAVAKTMGESSDNVLTAIDKAESRLGAAFEKTLSGNKVVVNDDFINGMVRVSKDAESELTEAQLGVLKRNIENILDATKGSGEIDGQAAYNIKKGLDRLSKNSDSSLAHYGRELRGELMDALNRSLGKEEAAAFKVVREQYKNMLTAARVVSRDAEGNIPMGGARLVDAAKKVGASDLEELGRISNQFLRDKTPDSGTARRLVGASLLAGTAGPNALLAVPAARVANSAMTSQTARNLLLNGSPLLKGAANKANLLLRPAAVEASSRISAP